MKKRKQETFNKGWVSNRRTEGDLQARTWLVQYLVGKPVGKAPMHLTVVV